MEGKHIIQAVNFNNGEALDLQSLNERLERSRLTNSDMEQITGGVVSCWSKGGCSSNGCDRDSCDWLYVCDTLTCQGVSRCDSDGRCDELMCNDGVCGWRVTY